MELVGEYREDGRMAFGDVGNRLEYKGTGS